MEAFSVDSHHSYSLFILILLSLYKKYAAAEQGMNWFISNELASTVRGVESPNLEALENRCPEAVNPRGTPFLVYTQSRPSSLLSWSTGMNYGERTVSRGCQPQGDTLPCLHPVPALLPPLLVYRYGLRSEDRCSEAVNPRRTSFIVYTQSRPSSLLSWTTGMD